MSSRTHKIELEHRKTRSRIPSTHNLLELDIPGSIFLKIPPKGWHRELRGAEEEGLTPNIRAGIWAPKCPFGIVFISECKLFKGKNFCSFSPTTICPLTGTVHRVSTVELMNDSTLYMNCSLALSTRNMEMQRLWIAFIK